MKRAKAGTEQLSHVCYSLSQDQKLYLRNCEERCNFYFKMQQKLLGGREELTVLPGPLPAYKG